MLEMVSSILTFLQTVVALVMNFINGLFTLLLLIPQAVVFVTAKPVTVEHCFPIFCSSVCRSDGET